MEKNHDNFLRKKKSDITSCFDSIWREAFEALIWYMLFISISDII